MRLLGYVVVAAVAFVLMFLFWTKGTQRDPLRDEVSGEGDEGDGEYDEDDEDDEGAGDWQETAESARRMGLLCGWLAAGVVMVAYLIFETFIGDVVIAILGVGNALMGVEPDRSAW